MAAAAAASRSIGGIIASSGVIIEIIGVAGDMTYDGGGRQRGNQREQHQRSSGKRQRPGIGA